MLQAKTKNGKFITLASLSKKEIAYHKAHKQFFCPTCDERVIVKAGTKMIPHFAHRQKVNCTSLEGGESGYHEKGKFLLYQWFKYQQLDVKLEAFLPDIRQRPDLLVTINRKQIAIEFQCARIGADVIQKRTAGYKQAGVTPIWIIGANQFKRKNAYSMKVDQFLRQLMHQFSSDSPLSLYFFCPNTMQFTFFQDIHDTTTQQAVGKLSFHSLHNIVFTDLFHQYRLSKQQLYTIWRKEKQRFRLRPRNRLYGRELAWHQWLYLKKTHVEHLPSVIYLPVAAQYQMRVPLWDWQSRLCLDLLNPLPIGGHISLQTCYHFLRNQMIPLSNFPLIKADNNPIQHYLLLLAQLNILKQKSSQHFIKQTNFQFHQSIEAALEEDKNIINQLITQLSQREMGK
ncbi:competence protein CoiA [Lentibacillus sp. Marseille-P4043]|uniref:competence protein CoiA n=1 Tax=Lentibacillus sp. Marseille-P4043 TaxID=2040293 RepID=UPI000D0B6046|nr:competence protein CoiA family protein [Lentibacillus sp. Marseille-P4043]